MKIISAKMRGALVEAGATDETAEAAAADISPAKCGSSAGCLPHYSRW